MIATSGTDKLEHLFGSFRAESLREDIYRLFNEPKYFFYLAAPKSCVLIGGRGSGKTTALKCMTYEGQDALGKTDFRAPRYVGLYLRINTNTVASFLGSELSKEEWGRLFAHFMNLTLCEEAAKYIIWLQEKFSEHKIDEKINYPKICRSLTLGAASSAAELLSAIEDARLDLEVYINNFSSNRPQISPLNTPINIMMQELRKLAGHETSYFYLILDEYENLLDYQQKLTNTLIKHSGGNYFFKVGVRDLGWRERSTINDSELLISPADYERIQIEVALEDDFADFAREVCKARLDAANAENIPAPSSVESLLPALSVRDEAMLLGVEDRIFQFREALRQSQRFSFLNEHHPHELYVFYELSDRNIEHAIEDLIAFREGQKSAREKYENYAYSLLFSIAGKGSEIKKYYCGHQVLAKITFQNIRFYMQLVNACIREQAAAGLTPDKSIDPRLQTLAARQVGLSYLRELEGVSTQGGALARLILGLGRVFQILASNPIGGKPECNQFELPATGPSVDDSVHSDATTLLREAVMHLALIRTPGTKLTTENDIRSWDYMPHPIFAPYFGFSHRRKRKMTISEGDLVGLTKTPQVTVKKLLGRRSSLADESLPQQMSMFDEYFI